MREIKRAAFAARIEPAAISPAGPSKGLTTAAENNKAHPTSSTTSPTTLSLVEGSGVEYWGSCSFCKSFSDSSTERVCLLLRFLEHEPLIIISPSLQGELITLRAPKSANSYPLGQRHSYKQIRCPNLSRQLLLGSSIRQQGLAT